MPSGLLVACDQSLATFATLTNQAAYTKSPYWLVDLAQTNAISRVLIYGTNSALKTWSDYGNQAHTMPLGLVVISVGNTPQSLTKVGDYAIPYDATGVLDQAIDVRFSPASGRYVKLELQTKVNWSANPFYADNTSYGWNNSAYAGDLKWQIAELEIHGTKTTQATNAIVLNSSARALKLAAADLSYYLTELTGQPHPIITSAQTNAYPGTLYLVDDLARLAPDYATMTNNIAKGLLPTNDVLVTQSGRIVKFSGWPHRVVCWGVWEFLERQGIRWAYPDAHGDYVPPQTNVNLSCLPLVRQSDAKSIYANFDVGMYQPWPAWVNQSPQQGWLYFWRNHWITAQNPGPWGAEVPYLPVTGSVDSQYAEGFEGYPHNMNEVMPQRILTNNPSWWGTGDGVNYTPYGVQFNLASDGAEAWLAAKVLAWDAVHHGPAFNNQSLARSHFVNSYNFLPVDAVTFSIDSETTAANALYGGPTTYLPWVWLWHPSSGAYYKLLSTVANIATNQIIGGLAYADVFDPPKSNYPSNVHMEICLYGSPNLPFTSPANAPMKQALDRWHQVCGRLSHYGYDLLFSDVWQPDNRIPVPMVRALVENAQYLAKLGALSGGTQANEGAIQFQPWSFYAWPRIRWNTNQTSDQILNEFFTAYYREAAAPMLAYYKALENYQYSNNIDLHFKGYCYNVVPGGYPVGVLNEMRTNLLAAQSLATNWFVQNRLNDAANSLGWVMDRLNLTPDLLTNYSAYATVPSSGTYTVPLTNFKQYTIYRAPYYAPIWNEDNNQAWNFDGSAIICQTLNFQSAGTYRVDVVNRCKYSDGTHYPTLRVILGPSASSTVATAPEIQYYTDRTNSYYLNIPSAGAHDLFIAQDRSGQFLAVPDVKLTKQ